MALIPESGSLKDSQDWKGEGKQLHSIQSIFLMYFSNKTKQQIQKHIYFVPVKILQIKTFWATC